MTDINKANIKAKGKDHPDLYRRAVKGAGWIAVLRVLVQLLSFGKYIILFNKLGVADVGLLGLSLLVVQSLEAFSQTGFQASLVQKKGQIDDYLDSAWTVGIIRAFCLYAILYLLAPFAATIKVPMDGLGECDISMAPAVIRVLGLALFLNAFTNIGVLYFRKDLRFKREFFFNIVPVLSNAIVTISIAFIWRSVWALVIGKLVGDLIKCLVSYLLSYHRVHLAFDWNKIKEMWGYGRWILGSTILCFVMTQGDDYFVWGYLGWVQLGYYQVAYKCSSMPAIELTNMISNVTFPAYSKIQDDTKRLTDAYIKVLKFTALFSFLVGGLMIFLIADFVELVLDPKWLPAISAMRILAIFTILRPLKAGTQALFMASGKPHLSTRMNFIKLFIIGSLIYPLTAKWQLEGTAMTVVLASILTIPLDLFFIKKAVNCRVFTIAKSLWVQFVALLVMLVVLWLIRCCVLQGTTYVSFAGLGVIGVLVYAVVVCICDKVSDSDILHITKENLAIFRGKR